MMRSKTKVPSSCRTLTAAMLLLAVLTAASAQEISELPIPIPKTITVFNAACESQQISRCLAAYNTATECVNRLQFIENAIATGSRAESRVPQSTSSLGPNLNLSKLAQHRQKTGMNYPQGCLSEYPYVVERQDCALAGKVAPQCVMTVPVYDPEAQTRQLNEWLKLLIDTGIIKPDGNG